MAPERWQRLERIYHEALEHVPDARAAFVAGECGTDRELRADVESLLANHASRSAFLEVSVPQEAAMRLADGQPMPSGGRVGHYRIVELVGIGGMGQVYRAWDEVLERDVAVKILAAEANVPGRPPFTLHREGRAAARLTHPNICTVHEVDQFEGRPYLVMEFVRGRTLAQVLAGSALPVNRVLGYGVQIADAVSHAHDRGVLHRDLKSANVMVTESDHVKVVDFGIAQRLDAATIEAVTKAGARPRDVLAGTLAYMSPELLRGETSDKSSDVWAIGVLLYQMATGELPFTGHTEFELASAILSSPPQPLLRNTPHALRSVIERCLDKNRDARYASAAEVREALAAVSGRSAFDRTALDDATVIEPGRPLIRGWRRVVTLPHRARFALAIVLLAGIGVGWWAWGRQDGSAPPSGSPSATIAVLPFRVEGAGSSADHLRLGIADRITARLSSVRSLRVRPVDAVARYLHGEPNAREARDLQVRYLLIGTARRSDNAYTVAVHLVETADNSTAWQQTFIVHDGSVITIEERVATDVVRFLDPALSDRERARLTRRHTPDASAYEQYLIGRTALLQLGEQGVNAAVRAFENALALDPNYAEAQAGLAIALVRRPWYASSPEEGDKRYEIAMRAAKRASELDPSLAEGHEAVAAVYRYREFEWEQVIQESAKTLELSPSRDLPYYNLSAAFYHLGLLDLSERAARAGFAINPRSRAEAVRNLGRSALYDGRYETAARSLTEAEKTSNDGPRWMLAEAWYYLGEHERSIEALERLEQSTQYIMRDRARASLAAILAKLGRRQAAERRLQMLVAQPAPDHHVSHRIGTAYAQLGNVDAAVRWIRVAATTGFPCSSWFERDPLLEPIQQHPSFLKLLDELRSMAQFRRSRWASLVGGDS